MINLSFLNKAVEQCEGNEFRLLYLIANTMSLKKEGHTKIYRDMLADKLNLSTKQITRLTNALEQKGLIKKDLVSVGDKTVCYYSLNLDKSVPITTTKTDKIVQINPLKVDKNVPLNNRNNIYKKEKDKIIEKIDNNENYLIEEFEKEIEDNKNIIQLEPKQTESKLVEDEVCDWDKEFIRTEARIRAALSVEELDKQIKLLSTKMKENYNSLPTDWEERVTNLREIRDNKVWTLKASKCYN